MKTAYAEPYCALPTTRMLLRGSNRFPIHRQCLTSRAMPWPAGLLAQADVARARRWVNCLLLREVPFPLAVRLWDTYVAEGGRMKEFLTYVLAAFLLCWAPQLRAMDFQARWRLELAVCYCYSQQVQQNPVCQL